MVTMAVDPVFVDTNILVYAAIPSSPFFGPAFGKLDAFRQAGVALWVSRQIFREYLAVLSRPQPYAPPVPAVTLIADIVRFEIPVPDRRGRARGHGEPTGLFGLDPHRRQAGPRRQHRRHDADPQPAPALDAQHCRLHTIRHAYPDRAPGLDSMRQNPQGRSSAR